MIASRAGEGSSHHRPDTVSYYLGQIGQRPLLDRAGEARLGRAVRDGKKASVRLAEGACLDFAERQRLEKLVRQASSAGGELVASNLRLVVSIAKHYQHRGVDLADLIQEGNLGLIKAAERFDPDLGYRFSTAALRLH